MKNPETIIRGIMHEAAKKSIEQLVGKHIGKKHPTATEAKKHFEHDEKAAKEIEKLAGSMEEETQLDEAKGRSNNLYGINHVQTGAHREIIKLANTLGYAVSAIGGKTRTMKVSTPEGRLITQITTHGGPAGNRKPLIDMHRHQLEIGGFSGTEHTHDTIRDAQRGIREEVEQLDEKSAAWQRKEGKDPEGGLNKKGVESYRRENPGSKLQTAVTTKPSKLKPGSKSAKRRKSFCSRMKGMKAKLTSAKTARDPDSRINKSLRKWNCE